jgi:putative ABC transport system ATP-binding protein
MDHSLYSYIWRHSRGEQIAILWIVVLSMPFYFLSLTLPRDIVNLITAAAPDPAAYTPAPFLKVTLSLGEPVDTWLGMPWEVSRGFAMAPMETLFALSGLFLALVVANGWFKMRINTLKGQMGERMLRRLRYELVDRVLRFPPRQFRKVKAAEVASMVKDEVEPLGGFIGEAIVWPAFLSLQALTAVLFIFFQSVWLGLVTVLIVGFQAGVVRQLRRPILALGRMRQLQARELSGRVGEIVEGVADIHAHDTSNFERSDITARLGKIYDIRFEIYQRKYFVKFLNNFLSQFTPFVFYALGGYLALIGWLNVGQLVAVIVAYKDLPGPIKELLDWLQQRDDVVIKYTQVIEQFQPEGMIDPSVQSPANDAPGLSMPVEFSGVTVLDDSGFAALDGVTLSLSLRQSVAVTGPSGGGKEAFAQLFARQAAPASGTVKAGGEDLTQLPEAITGRRIGYAGADAFALSGSLRDNVLYGLKNAPRRTPPRSAEAARTVAERIAEAARAGNAPFDPDADWLPDGILSAHGEERLLDALAVSGLESDVFQWGLQARIDPLRAPEAAARFLEARKTLRARLQSTGAAAWIESFDPDAFNRNASLAENILFGTSSDPEFALNRLASNPQVRRAVAGAELENDLVAMGRSIAETMLELFRDFAADHPFFEEYSFIPAGEMPLYDALLKRARGAVTLISGADRERLLALPFRYVEARHRLDLIEESVKAKIVRARQSFEIALRGQGSKAVDFYEPLEYNSGASVQDNVLFGRIAYGVAQAPERVNALIREILSADTLEPIVLNHGLDFQAGAGGKRLSPGQKQKLGLARAVLKAPDLLVVNGALAALDDRQRSETISRVLASRQGRATVWVLPHDDLARLFERTLRFEHGKLVFDSGAQRQRDAAQ